MNQHPERHGAVNLDIREVARRLNDALGGTLVAALAGVDDPMSPYGWAAAGGPQPGAVSAQRLRCAYEQWKKVSTAEGDDVARAWFIGANPWLDHAAPIDAIRLDRLKQVAAAAGMLVDGSFSG